MARQFRIEVIVDPRGARTGTDRVRRDLATLEDQANSLRRTLQGAFAFLGIGITVQELIRLADAFTTIQNRLRVVSSSTAEVNGAYNELFAIAQRTRSSFEATAETYVRTSLATRNLGLSARETAQFTESLNQAVIISGATTQEAQAGLIQFSQGLASGALRGDELRSVLEQLPAVADVIATQLGVTRGELRDLGAQGVITSDQIILAFQNAREELAERFGRTVPTLTQSFVVLRNALIETFGRIDEATGFTQSLARVIIGLAENMDTVVNVFQTAAQVIGVQFAAIAIRRAIAGIAALNAAIAANPIGALVVAITAGISALIAFRNEIAVTSDGLVTLDDFGRAAFDDTQESLSSLASSLRNDITPLVEDVAQAFDENFGDISENLATLFADIDFSFEGFLRLTARTLDLTLQLWDNWTDTVITTVARVPVLISEILNNVINGFTSLVEAGINTAIDFVNETARIGPALINQLTASFPLLQDQLQDIFPLVQPENIIDPVQLSRTTANLSGELEVLADDIRRIFADNEGLDLFEARLDTILARARTESARRRAEEARRRAEEEAALNRERERAAPGVSTAVQRRINELAREADLLQVNGRERDTLNQIIRVETELRRRLNTAETIALTARISENQVLQDQANILDRLRGPQEELNQRAAAARTLFDRQRISAQELANELRNIRFEQAALNVEQGTGSFADGFLLGIEQMIQGLENFRATAGSVFAEFHETVTQGIGDATAQALIFGDSFTQALGQVALTAVRQVVSSFAELGAQFLINQALSQAQTQEVTQQASIQIASANAVAANSVALQAQTAVQSEILATTLAAAWAGPAALASLATVGANAAPANLAIAQTTAFAQGIAAFADGGFVSGPGGPQSDSIPAFLSNGEFVVTAAATRRFRPQLEAINRGEQLPQGSASPSRSDSLGSPLQNPENTPQMEGVTVVNVVDPNQIQRYLDSVPGRRAILNVINENPQAVRRAVMR